MIRNIKIHNILNVIKISKFMKPNKYTHRKFLFKKNYLDISYDFKKINRFKKIKG